MKSRDWKIISKATIHTRILETTALTFSTFFFFLSLLQPQTAACCLCRSVSCMGACRIPNEISAILQHDIMPSRHCHNTIAIVAISRRLIRGSSEIRLHVAWRFQAVTAEVRRLVFRLVFFFFHSRYFLYPLYWHVTYCFFYLSHFFSAVVSLCHRFPRV